MKRPVLWSRDAAHDIKAQGVYIATDNSAAAQRVAAQIRKAGAALGDMATGRPGRVPKTYEKLVPRLPYILAYVVAQVDGRETVVILRVIHTARDWPDEGWPE